ncbi:MAG: hypothetical protein ACU0B9_20945 [Limimaricola soesokkakensis]|uniref:hypothetical protein n=1 Tax=Limimaricola soesokkakensis TaxID=1343159 RepID=UPI00405930D1
MIRLLAAACAALLMASTAMAGPGGCGDRHNVTADAMQDRSLPESSEMASASPVETPAPSIDLLALLDGALPSEAASTPR